MVIVAVANLIVRNCIIFVNNWDASQFQQTTNGVARVEILLSVNKVMRNKQHLCRHQ